MLSRLRHLFVDSWFGRILVVLIFVVFVGWGVSDIFINVWNNGLNNDPNVVANVGDRKISIMELDNNVQKELMNFSAKQGFSDPSQIPPFIKQILAKQVLQTLITQNVLVNRTGQLGITIPDQVLREAVWSLPEFQIDGKFNRDQLNIFLQRANLSETKFLQMIREQLSVEYMLDPLSSGVRAPDVMVNMFFQFYNQTRTMAFIHVPYTSFQPSSLPTEPVLKRYYDNHPWEFQIPEYRRVKLVVLSPETVASSLEIPDKTLRQYYDAEKNQFIKSEARDFQIVTFSDPKKAQVLFGLWSHHADWQQVQDFAQKNQGTALEMTQLQRAAIPLPELAQHVFSSGLGMISEPFQTTTGWTVIKVNKVTSASHTDFEAAKLQLKSQIAKLQAEQLLGGRVTRLQDILAGGNGLDRIDSDLGVAAVEGTLDEQGLTQNGEQAPIPAKRKFRQDILVKIFSTAKNAQPALIADGNNSYYAFIVEDVLPAHEADYIQAKDRVIKAWRNSDSYRQANIAATDVYKAVSVHKKTLKEVKSQFPLQNSKAFSRENPVQNLPSTLQAQAFVMKVGDTVMVEAPDGFVVATLTSVVTPLKKDNPENYQRIEESLTQAMKNDTEMSYAASLQRTAKSFVNQKAFESFVNQLNH